MNPHIGLVDWPFIDLQACEGCGERLPFKKVTLVNGRMLCANCQAVPPSCRPCMDDNAANCQCAAIVNRKS